MSKLAKAYAIGATAAGIFGWMCFAYHVGRDSKNTLELTKEDFDELYNRAYTEGADAGYSIGFSDRDIYGHVFKNYSERGNTWVRDDL